jgi:hypothetical protein
VLFLDLLTFCRCAFFKIFFNCFREEDDVLHFQTILMMLVEFKIENRKDT